ncbi:hypothetical protein FOJ82_13445 [Tessaracoccus rhinocerotis]|uniref:OmpA family protein n=1 Tax=Tessaracoccus rhinocerotis TaxID=1689449 RepID=A0A553JWQ4_9ACTN|nr:hypothetical protein [Tessaracoccus rhinocerotis]TRY16872.1 hypothetical protein FOJ82_13445 [Tessaracoccus rhinocerotis]
MKNPITALLCSATLVVGLGACTSSQATELEPIATDGVVIVTASHANVPMPRLSPSNREQLGLALERSMPVSVVSADGSPEPVAIQIPTVTGGNGPARQRSVSKALSTVEVAVTALPNSDEVSAYGALAVARDSALALGLKRPVIICLLCGIDTVGALGMTADGALRSDPGDVTDYLRASGQLLELGSGFEEIEIHLTSTGWTAGPQAPLSPQDRDNLTAIWTAALEAGGAVVKVDPNPLSGDAVVTPHTVTPVSVAPPEPVVPVEPTPEETASCTPQQFSFDGASGARFRPETAEWVSLDEARAALTPIARWLAAVPSRTARIQGTTANVHSGDPDEGIELSRRRAEAAAALVIELGAAPEQIVATEGLGPNYPEYVPDHDADGNPVPSLRTKNRKVIVILREEC